MINLDTQRKETSEVYLSNENHIKINSDDMQNLITLAKKNTRERVRFCSHSSADEIVHEMFIVHPKDAYVRPHKHINKSESMIVLEGEVDYIIFDEYGNISDIESMGDYKSGKTFYTRINSEEYHSLVIHSEWLVFLEITKGPFNKEETLFAPWSPIESESEEIKAFMNKLKDDSKI
ncbi:MAG: WbuC family cupin fold metalloprotein [Sulfuricurvum sp.]|jgi:cupin fold WbuC family metalloprotein